MPNPAFDEAFAAALQGPSSRVGNEAFDEAWKEAQRGLNTHQPSKAAKPPFREYDPAAGMSGTDLLLSGAGKAFYDLARGVGQFTPLVSRADVAEARKLDEPLMNKGMGSFGNFVGNGALMAPAGFIPKAGTILGGAAIGGAMGLAAPSTDTDETLMNTGFGTAAGAAIPAAVRAMKVGKAAIDPFYQGGRDRIVGSALRAAAGNQADDAVRSLVNWRQLVPGSQATAAEAAQNPGIAALQRTASQSNNIVMGDLNARMLANNEARIAALRAVAGDREASVAARDAATKALYQMADGKTITITPELEALLERPNLKSAVATARELSANFRGPGNFSLTKAIEEHTGPLLTTVPRQPGTIKGNDAHTIKMALDDIIEGGADGIGLAKNARRAAAGNREQFLTNIESQMPAFPYWKARQTFADMSRPVNQADVAALIEQRAVNNIRGEMTPAAYNRALNDRTAQAALQRKGATIDGTFEPDQLATLNAIKQDLKNLDFANTAGKGVGSDTVQKLAMSHVMESLGLPGFLSVPRNIAGNFINLGYKDANRRVSEQLAETLLSPELTAKLMKDGITPKGLLMLEDVLTRQGATTGGGLLSPFLRDRLSLPAAEQ